MNYYMTSTEVEAVPLSGHAYPEQRTCRNRSTLLRRRTGRAWESGMAKATPIPTSSDWTL
jgi:hypothetical protein